MAEHLTLAELLQAVEIVDAHIDSATSPQYREQPLALDWARVTKVCEEAGEVWRALSKMTGENPRKGVCGTEDELLGELGDTVSAGLCAIQHLTKDTEATWAVVSAALAKARHRASEHPMPDTSTLCTHCGGTGDEPVLPSAEAVRCYLRVAGWQPGDVGVAGTLWSHPDWPHAGIGVGHEMEPGSFEWRSVIYRLALAEHRASGQVVAAISRNQRVEPARD
jgi:NTP pyrophosphatase (non-canonical NTP hydrolase)